MFIVPEYTFFVYRSIRIKRFENKMENEQKNPLSRRWDSNPRLAVYKTATLPLSYFGKLSFTGSRSSKPNFNKFCKILLGQNSCSTTELSRRKCNFTKIEVK